MLIRNFTLTDQDKLQALALKCWLFTYKDIYTPEKIKKTVEDWYSKKTHQDYLKLMESGDALLKVAEENGQIIGFVSTEKIHTKAGAPIELKRLYVDPDHLRKGLGGKLIDLVEKKLKENGPKEYFCFVHRKNKIGQSFYQKKGFSYDESKSTVEDFYMCKKLS